MACDYFPYFSWSGGAFSGGPLAILLWLLMVLLAGLLTVGLFRYLKLRGGPGFKRDREDSLDILKTRYARGELERTEYLKMKETLLLP